MSAMFVDDVTLRFHRRRSIEEGVHAIQSNDERARAVHNTLAKLHAIAADALGEAGEPEQNL